MEKKTATIEHLVTDMGNGGANCSNCNHDITSYLDECLEETLRTKKMAARICPNCQCIFTESNIWISPGGSDF